MAITRKAALFAGSEGGGANWAIATTLVRTALPLGSAPTVAGKRCSAALAVAAAQARPAFAQ